MPNFNERQVELIIEDLLNGRDYRRIIINSISEEFFTFSIDFFKKIVMAKFNNLEINLDWYKQNFILAQNLNSSECAIYAGINKKTITNIYKSATKEIVIAAAEDSYEYLKQILQDLDVENSQDFNIQIKLVYNNISVELNLKESLLVINALATKKISLRGGAWSSIGKQVEKPLMLKLCELCHVDPSFIDSSGFRKNIDLDYDREVDFVLLTRDKQRKRCEVKLMGKGNPESADAVIARDSDIFIADTLSEQNKKQLSARNVKWLELKNSLLQDNIQNFRKILIDLDIPTQNDLL